MRHRFIVAICLAALLAGPGLSCTKRSNNHQHEPAPSDADPPEVVVGERLFLETRFARFVFANGSEGDPVMDLTVTPTGEFPGPFAGKAMNCRACHLVDEHRDTPGGGVRTYADFAVRSPIPARADGKTVTPRNSPALVNASVERSVPEFFHFDGEFASLEDLIRATYTGRNFGWLPGEKGVAIEHIVDVIHGDDGKGDLAAEFGALPYRVLLTGRSGLIPPELKLPYEFRVDVNEASDEQIFNAIVRLVAAYVRSLEFARNEDGEFVGSAFDAFLDKNGLSRSPNPGESELEYARRLRDEVSGLSSPAFVDDNDGALTLHEHPFAFGPQELQGLRIFLSEPSALPPTPGELAAGKIGNCLACHAPPNFTDFRFHNVGTAQGEFDGIHGSGQFAALVIPSLTVRNATPDLYLPASAVHPGGLGPFLDVPSPGQPGHTDLGLWNVFANDAVPLPQASLRTLLGLGSTPSDADLDSTIALFKTPSLRDLGQSGPYFHTGQKATLSQVLQHYQDFSELSRTGQVRNGAPELNGIVLKPVDLDSLRAFLRSLDEDYE